MNIKETVKKSNRYYEYMAGDWRDGLLLGNGSLASIAYAPGGVEWVVNKNDVFDRRVFKQEKILRHHEVLERIENGEVETFDFDEIEKKEPLTIRSVSPCILRFSNGSGELGWNAPAFPKYSGELDIYDGTLKIDASAHFVHSRIRAVIPRGTSLFAIRVEGCAIIDWNHKIELYRPYHDEMDEPVWYSDEEGMIAFTQKLPGEGSYAVALLAVPREPDISRVDYKLPRDFDYSKLKASVSKPSFGKLASSVSNGGDVDIFLSVYSDYDSENPLESALAEVKAAAKEGFASAELAGLEYWHSFWDKSCLDFGKYKDIQDYALFSMYELASSYSKAPMPALSGMLYGPLNPTTPGVIAHNYTSDQNIQIPLMPASVINHPELVSALADTFMNAYDEMREHTKLLFPKTGGKGIFIPLVSNQNGKELMSGSYRYTMCGGAYVGTVFARTWEYTRCDSLMREKLYPLLSEIVRFYVSNLMHKVAGGKYHIDPTVPPEIFYFTKDETAVTSMLKTCLRTALIWCEKEGIDNEETALWRDVLQNYPELSCRPEGGWWCGDDIPLDHFTFGTHILYPFFPSEEYVTEEDRTRAKATLDYIDREAIERTYAGRDGWHFIHDWSWYLYYNTAARLDGADKNALWQNLFTFLDMFAKPNGLFTHNSVVTVDPSVSEHNHDTKKRIDEITADYTTGPDWYGSGMCATPNAFSKNLTAPVIEGNSIFLLRAAETLLQSFDGIIRLFPATPDDFSGGFENLVARGGFRVTAQMQDGKLSFAHITAIEAEDKKHSVCRILDDGRCEPCGKSFVRKVRYGIKVLEFSVNPGETVELSVN